MSFFLSPNATVTIESYPYRHVIIEDVFHEDLADRLHEFHQRTIGKAKPVGSLEEIGERLYSAKNYTPDMVDISSTSLSVLFSHDLRLFIAGLLGVATNDCILLNIHRHDPPSKDGHPHTDCAVVSYPKDGPRFNGLNVYQASTGCEYADDTRDGQPDSLKVARSLACLYYVGDKNWQPGDGGETGMYDIDEVTVLKRVPPRHNSLFAFDTSPVSYHAYLAAPRKVRDSFIWWYHDDVARVMRRHKLKFEQKRARGRDPWDRWTDPSQVKYEPPVEV